MLSPCKWGDLSQIWPIQEIRKELQKKHNALIKTQPDPSGFCHPPPKAQKDTWLIILTFFTSQTKKEPLAQETELVRQYSADEATFLLPYLCSSPFPFFPALNNLTRIKKIWYYFSQGCPQISAFLYDKDSLFTALSINFWKNKRENKEKHTVPFFFIRAYTFTSLP